MSRSLGIPVKLLHEASGHVVTVELKSGELYRGSMIECEDNWNCQLESITYTAKLGEDDVQMETGAWMLEMNNNRFREGFGTLWMHTHMRPRDATVAKYIFVLGSLAWMLLGFGDGKTSQLEHVFIRGSKVRFMVIPDMLKNAPMFKRLDARIKGKGASLGVGRGRAVAMRAKAQAAGRGAAPGRGVPPVRR
ncbi:Small nuclear ribonucleoprotein Sm D3 [Sesbania bispinosa]|nr:Small nuclear ribonucleoprotein Sm D3 [Sesbania bispinosa]